MKMLMIRIANASVSGLCLTLVAFACSRSADSNQDTTQMAQSGQTLNPDAPIMLRGTVTSVSANQLVLKSDTGAVTVALTQPFHLYVRAPSDLSHVKESSFIGVTTVKQPDGSERATEIHVFPEELRGLGEGSRMMAPTEPWREPNDERQRVSIAYDQRDGVAVANVEWQRKQHQRVEPRRPVRGRFSERDSAAEYACYRIEACLETSGRRGPGGRDGEEGSGWIAHCRQGDIHGEVIGALHDRAVRAVLVALPSLV